MIAVSGSLAFDRIMDFPGYFKDHLLPEKLHEISVSFMINDLVEHFGGTAGNIAYSLALLGERPIVLASAGNDYSPYKAWQKKHGINTSLVFEVVAKKSASAYIMTDKADNQITAFYPGAMMHRIKNLESNVKKLDKEVQMAIVSPGNIDDMRILPKFYRKYKIPYIFDPGQALPALSKEDLVSGMDGAEVLMVNDYELALVQKKTGFTKKQILDKVITLVTTLGEKGSLIEHKNGSYKIPPAKANKIIDPTGAGDAYRAGFIYGIARKWSFERIGRFAAVTAVHAVEKAGTQTHQFTVASLKKRYKKNFNETL